MAKFRCLSCMQEFDNSATTICPMCGYDQITEKKESYHLNPGSTLENRYLIGKAIGAGGFGITYVAWDSVLSKKVAIKEYFPSEFGTRMIGSDEVCAYDGEKSYQFEAGLKSFVDEALRLAKLNQLGSIVHIYDSFVANCTAYIVMEYVNGVTLKDMLFSRGPLPYQDVIKYVVPVLNALEEVHREGIIHRDIAPDNIKVDGDKVTLLDFGAARNATTVHSKSLSVIVKPGYAPEEQYRSRGDQGPWTDVYAMAAVMYHLITGKLPDESVERNVKDELKTPTELGYKIPEAIENAIMNALNVKAEYRIQSAKEFADALTGAISLERVVVKQAVVDDGKWSTKTKVFASVAAVISVILIAAIILTSTNLISYNFNRVEVADFMGETEEEVQISLEEMGLDSESYELIGHMQSDQAEAGTIIWQQYEPGVKLSNEEVNSSTFQIEMKIVAAEIVKADKKSKTATMPSLRAMTKAEIRKALKTAGIKNYEFKIKESKNMATGRSCDQSVKANTKINKNKKVIVYISKKIEKDKATPSPSPSPSPTPKPSKKPKKTPKPKPKKTAKPTPKPTPKPKPKEEMVTVPNVVGMSSNAAKTRLASMKLYPLEVTIKVSNANQHGMIISTNPGAGSKVKAGTKITLNVGLYEEFSE